MSFKTSAICPRKAQARLDTIINTYRDSFQQALPQNKQFWTLAGPCFDENGNLGKNSEVSQLHTSGLITLNQYHGVDNGKEIIDRNRKAAPSAKFYHGDFITQLKLEAEIGNFNPGIVHADFTRMAKSSVAESCEIVHLIENYDISDTMLVVNFPANNPYAGKLKGEVDAQEIWQQFKNNQRFNHSWNDRWTIKPHHYQYGGTGVNSKTTMVTFVFLRR